MKKTKIIIPAIGMLLLSTAASISGTVAWFSMNASVTATGMAVHAVSDSFFLEIAADEDLTYGTVGTNDINAGLYPAAHEDWDALADVADFDMVTPLTYDNWYYRYSDSTSNASTGLTAKTYLSTFANYVATCSFNVRLQANSGQATAYDLYVSSVTLPALTGIRVVITGAQGYNEFSTTAATIAPAANAVLSDIVTKTEQVISVYIYIDGNDANVYTDNYLTLTGAVEFKLAVLATNP